MGDVWAPEVKVRCVGVDVWGAGVDLRDAGWMNETAEVDAGAQVGESAGRRM